MLKLVSFVLQEIGQWTLGKVADLEVSDMKNILPTFIHFHLYSKHLIDALEVFMEAKVNGKKIDPPVFCVVSYFQGQRATCRVLRTDI